MTPSEPAASSGAGTPTVAVVIPTYNRAAVLPRAIASVLAQTFEDFEVIVVDDGSTDGTPSVRSLISDPRICWIEGSHAGVSAARNRAAASACGEWLAFLDDDNEWLPEYLESQLAAAVTSGADLVYCLGAEVDRGGTVVEQSPPPHLDPVVAATYGWCPFTSCVVVRRSVFLAAGGFPLDLSQSEDRSLWLRLALRCRWAPTRATLMHRHRDGGPRLSDDLVETRRADADLERRYHRAVRRRVGLPGSMRWFWRSTGRDEFRRMIVEAERHGRRAAWRSLVVLAAALPRSATSMVRPLVVLVVGSPGYWSSHRRYHQIRRVVTRRLRS